MKLIIEQQNQNLITENKGKDLYITGVFSSAETKNDNNRIYSKSLLEREIKSCNEKIENGTLYGQLNHPNEPSINLKEVSHIITELNWKNNDVIGKAKILTETPNGKIAKSLIENGKIGISSRGLGTVDEKTGYVNDDFKLITYDLVHAASNEKSKFVNGILESKEFSLDDIQEQPSLKERFNIIQEQLKNIPEDTFIKMLGKYYHTSIMQHLEDEENLSECIEIFEEILKQYSVNETSPFDKFKSEILEIYREKY